MGKCMANIALCQKRQDISLGKAEYPEKFGFLSGFSSLYRTGRGIYIKYCVKCWCFPKFFLFLAPLKNSLTSIL